MLQSVKKLEPGHAMIVEQGRLQRRWRFYQLPYDARPPIDSVSEAMDMVRGGLREAVRRQLVADVSVGTFLSGGLDSSLVVAMVKELAPDAKPQCFTIGFRDQAFAREGHAEDLPYAQRVAAHLKVDLHTITVGSEMIQMLERMLYHLDEPQADPAALHVYLISQLARQQGIKVLLSGTGGDDIFSGYRRHYAFAQEHYWSWIPRPLRQMISQTTSHLPTSGAILRRVNKAFQYAHLDGNERIASYFYWLPPAVARTLCGPALRDCRALQDPSSPLVEALRELPQGSDSLSKMLFLDAKFFLADHNLNYTDKMSMAAGVEVRVPYLDPDLMAVAARLPSKFKQHGVTGKWVLKKVAEPYLPCPVM
jgi:asparagine synthase (glutamine-hydrolysing)